MLALGISNIMGSFVSSMPVTGSFTRTAVNNASGAQTPLGGIVTGTMLLLALAFLTKTFYYIPKATLAAVVICAMFYLFDYHAAVTLWKTKSKYLYQISGADCFYCAWLTKGSRGSKQHFCPAASLEVFSSLSSHHFVLLGTDHYQQFIGHYFHWQWQIACK